MEIWKFKKNSYDNGNISGNTFARWVNTKDAYVLNPRRLAGEVEVSETNGENDVVEMPCPCTT